MNYFLDVNLLLAWGWSDHADHLRAATWIAAIKARRGTKLFTSSIVELGFIRVSVQRSGGRVTVADAGLMLAGMFGSLGNRHVFIADDISPAGTLPSWCVGRAQTTDAHLLALAQHHGASLATLDTKIPGAFVPPTLR